MVPRFMSTTQQLLKNTKLFLPCACIVRGVMYFGKVYCHIKVGAFLIPISKKISNEVSGDRLIRISFREWGASPCK